MVDFGRSSGLVNYLQSLDALILPGGWCPDYLRRDKRFVNLVKDMVDAGWSS